MQPSSTWSLLHTKSPMPSTGPERRRLQRAAISRSNDGPASISPNSILPFFTTSTSAGQSNIAQVRERTDSLANAPSSTEVQVNQPQNSARGVDAKHPEPSKKNRFKYTERALGILGWIVATTTLYTLWKSGDTAKASLLTAQRGLNVTTASLSVSKLELSLEQWQAFNAYRTTCLADLVCATYTYIRP